MFVLARVWPAGRPPGSPCQGHQPHLQGEPCRWPIITLTTPAAGMSPYTGPWHKILIHLSRYRPCGQPAAGRRYSPVLVLMGPFMNWIIPSMVALSPFIFQFPPTKNFLWPDILVERETSVGAGDGGGGGVAAGVAGGGRRLLPPPPLPPPLPPPSPLSLHYVTTTPTLTWIYFTSYKVKEKFNTPRNAGFIKTRYILQLFGSWQLMTSPVRHTVLLLLWWTAAKYFIVEDPSQACSLK